MLFDFDFTHAVKKWARLSKLKRIRQEKAARHWQSSSRGRFPHATLKVRCLPVEVMGIVLDYLHNDRNTLGSMSLFSREWTRPAQLHLFRSLCISTRQLSVSPNPARFYQLADFLKDSTAIARFPTSLRIRPAQFYALSLAIDHASILVFLLRILPCLQHLTLEELDFTDPSDPPEDPPQSRPVSLQTLRLLDIMDNGDNGGRLLDVLSVEDMLELTRCKRRPWNALFDPDDDQQRPLRPRHLKVRDSLDMFPRFGTNTTFPRLRRLSVHVTALKGSTTFFDTDSAINAADGIDPAQVGNQDALDEFLHRFGTSLEAIRIDVCAVLPTSLGEPRLLSRIPLAQFCISRQILMSSRKPCTTSPRFARPCKSLNSEYLFVFYPLIPSSHSTNTTFAACSTSFSAWCPPLHPQ